MTLKKRVTNKAPKKRAIVKAKPKSNLIFAGALFLFTQPKNPKEQMERKLVLLSAEVLKVSPFGVNILGGQPYVNNTGLKQKKEQYCKTDRFEFEWVHIAKDDDEKAIVKCRIVDAKDKPKMPFVIGECSSKTMSMRTLHGYQNHLAQTRAENRAIKHLHGIRMHEEMLSEIGKRLTKSGDEESKKLLGQTAGVTQTSHEEMPPTEKMNEDTLFIMAQDRIEEIKGDKIALREALKKVDSMTIAAHKRQMLKEIINGHLRQKK